MYGGNRPLGGFGQGWQGGNRGNRNNNRGGYGNPMYGNRGGMRPQGWGGMGGYGNMGGNQGGGWGNAWGQPQNMGGYGRMPNQMQPNQGMNYANAVKVSSIGMSHLYYSSFQGDSEFIDLSDGAQSIDFVSMRDECITGGHTLEFYTLLLKIVLIMIQFLMIQLFMIQLFLVVKFSTLIQDPR